MIQGVNGFVGGRCLLVMWLWLEEQVPVVLLWAPGWLVSFVTHAPLNVELKGN